MTEEPVAGEEHLRAGLTGELGRLKERAAEMGRWALTMVHDGWRAFRAGDLGLAQQVLDRDTELDRLDQEIEREVIGFFVVRQPAAGDLRHGAALLKITTHVDRIGRLGFDMARLTAPTDGRDVPELLALLDAMDLVVESMVQQSLDALARDDAPRAKELFTRDDEVDRMYRKATALILRGIAEKTGSPVRLTREMLVVRHFERIADNACKIAERTIYAVTGERRREYLPRHPYHPYVLEPPDDATDVPGSPAGAPRP
jgi:phosphate transport system protein